MAKPVLTISYKNDTTEVIPHHAVLQLTKDIEETDDGLSVLVKKFDGDGEHFAIDDGKGATTDDTGGKYGQCIKALCGLFWVHYVGETAPATPWETEVGPVEGQWYVDATGSGFVYAGLHDPDNERILVMQLAGGGNFVEGRLTTAMTPASNSLTGATTFKFKRFVVLDGSVTPKILKEKEGEDETGVNRDTTLAAGVDAYVHLKKINGEWRPSPVSDVCAEG